MSDERQWIPDGVVERNIEQEIEVMDAEAEHLRWLRENGYLEE